MARKSLRSQLYRAARDLGNVEAAEKGPASYGRRVVRRKAYRTANGALGKILRGFLKGWVMLWWDTSGAFTLYGIATGERYP